MTKHIDQAMHTLSLKTEIRACEALTRQGFAGMVGAKRAPSTLTALLKAQGTGLLPVWYGACDKTIYDTPRHNMLARAWHDCLHIELQAELDAVGERAVAVYARDSTRHCLTELERGLMWTEVVGQLEHLQQFGAFPDDQRAFALDYINRGYKLGGSFA